MNIFLIVLAILALLIALLAFTRVGSVVEYSSDGFLAWVRFGPLRIQIYPRRKRKRRQKTKADQSKSAEQKKSAKSSRKKRKKKSGKPSQKTEERQDRSSDDEIRQGGPLDLIRDFLPVGLDLLGNVKRSLLVEELQLHYTIPGRKDPARAAILYGQLCATGGALAGLLEEHFKIRLRRYSAWVDFTATEGLVYVRLSLSFTIAQLIRIGLHSGIQSLRILRKRKKHSDVPKTGGQ